MKQTFIKKALFAYYCSAAMLWTYLIVTSLWFTYEHFIGTIPAGMPWVFGVIGLAFALRFFHKKMLRFNSRSDDFLLVRGQDIITVVVLTLAALAMFAALAYGWLKLYPVLF